MSAAVPSAGAAAPPPLSEGANRRTADVWEVMAPVGPCVDFVSGLFAQTLSACSGGESGGSGDEGAARPQGLIRVTPDGPSQTSLYVSYKSLFFSRLLTCVRRRWSRSAREPRHVLSRAPFSFKFTDCTKSPPSSKLCSTSSGGAALTLWRPPEVRQGEKKSSTTSRMRHSSPVPRRPP